MNPGIDYETRSAWLEARRSMIGASDTAAIFGVGYADSSAVTVWDAKVHPHRGDDPKKLKMFRVGKLMEPALRSIFHEETGLPCTPAGEHTIYRHKSLDFIGATLDAWTLDERGEAPVELKKIDFGRGDWSDDTTPLKFQVQVQQQMLVTDTDHAYVFGLLGNEPAVRIVPRNDRFIDAMVKRLIEFWGYVQRREMPPVDESEATAKLLAKLFPSDNGQTVTLPAEADQWLAERELAKEGIKKLEAKLGLVENQIKAAIGDATFGETSSGRLVSWKEQEREGYVVPPTTFRVLRVLKRKAAAA